MPKVSILIPARGESASNLQRTVADVYAKATGSIEVLVGFDGPPYQDFPDYPDLRVYRMPQVIGLKGCAALWSPKVLRAGMGAHFALQLIEGLAPEDLEELKVPLLVTSSHHGDFLHQQALPMPCAWAMGHEGQGVGDELMARASLKVRIDQPGGEESLNVAAAAAICLYASSLAVIRR